MDQISWKHKIVGNQPIIAYKAEPNLWVIVGGTWKVKEELEKRGVRFSNKYYANIFEGDELSTKLLELIDITYDPTKQQKDPYNPPKGKYPRIKQWYRRDDDQKMFTMFMGKKVEIPSFIAPSYWEELEFYMANPAIYPAIAIVGPTGNSKTTSAIAINEHFNKPYVVIDMTEFVTPDELIGGMTFEPQKGTFWQDGTLTAAFRHGMNIIINEYDAANPRAALSMQSVLQDPGFNGKGRYVTTPGNPNEDRVYPAGNCTIIATMNTYGTGATRMYVGRNSIDQATMDRFAFISSAYEHEVEILRSRKFKATTANTLKKWADNTRKKIDENGLRLNVSPRTLMRMATLMEKKEYTLEQAAVAQFYNRIDPDDRELLTGK